MVVTADFHILADASDIINGIPIQLANQMNKHQIKIRIGEVVKNKIYHSKNKTGATIFVW